MADTGAVERWLQDISRRATVAVGRVLLWTDEQVAAALNDWLALLGHLVATVLGLRAELDAWERDGGPTDIIATHRAVLDQRWAWVQAAKHGWDTYARPAAQAEIGLAPVAGVVVAGLFITIMGLAWMSVCLDEGRTVRQDLEVERLAIQTGRTRQPGPGASAGAPSMLLPLLAATALAGGAWWYSQRSRP